MCVSVEKTEPKKKRERERKRKTERKKHTHTYIHTHIAFIHTYTRTCCEHGVTGGHPALAIPLHVFFPEQRKSACRCITHEYVLYKREKSAFTSMTQDMRLATESKEHVWVYVLVHANQ